MTITMNKSKQRKIRCKRQIIESRAGRIRYLTSGGFEDDRRGSFQKQFPAQISCESADGLH